ncbi:conjugal transfer pilus assembly protein TraE [Candidatus Rubidus massiliensis]|nr:conjugal transfer pilus assembly protein TraE [Candidatus Rubidus massiliensis]
MNVKALERDLSQLTIQKNVFAAVSIILSIALTLSIGFLFFKNEKTIIVPPMIEKEFWINTNSVSSTYIEQFGVFLAQQILQKSSASATSQREVILKYTSPDFIGPLKNKLLNEEEALKKQNASYVFLPCDINADAKNLELKITGNRIVYVAQKQVSNEKETYILKFCFDGSRLLLSNLIINKDNS